VATEPDSHLMPIPRMRPARSFPNTCPYASFGSQKIQPYVAVCVDGDECDISSLIRAYNNINGLANKRFAL
jgi:hypothetical protein